MKKKIISALILAALTALFAACGENGTEEKNDEPQGGISLVISETAVPSKNIYDTSGPQTNEVSSASEAPAESAPAEETSGETSAEASEENNAPEWAESEASGERYVNTDRIYSRIKAVQGSEKVKQYSLNDKVSVVAKTDTGYYRLNDGTFIHEDYLSEDEIADNTDNTEETEISLEWVELSVSGERYVNTDYVYSRINAVQGSEKVKQYRLNDKVEIVAKTDTGYYKLSDGAFIHEDYLSEDEVSNNAENSGGGEDYISVTSNGYVIERTDGITYVDGIMIANKTYTLPDSYDPGIKKEAADALSKMQSAAAEEGLSLFVVSGYRSYRSQESVYEGWVSRDGKEKADTYSSRPGHSDHQTGYTFDLNSLEQSFAYTREGIWLAEHCADFGFIIRYPEGKEMYTGYIYEPWHIRYIGVEKAKTITESGLSLEEYYGFTSDYADCEVMY